MNPYAFILIVSLFLGLVDVKENAKSTGTQETREPFTEVTPVPRDFPCEKCDYIVKGYHNRQGEELNAKPGQVICLDAKMKYNKVVFNSIRGTADNPIIIRNCGGKAVITSDGSFGLKFEECAHFKLLGDGSSDSTYGIKISTPSGFFLTLEKFTSNFEVALIEIAGPVKNGQGEQSGFAGIGIKTSPYQACDLFADSTRQAWVMKNVSVHHNYIHDTGGEGMYIGHGFYKGRLEPHCTKMTYSHSIKGLRVHHNIVENTGFDGIQIKNADDDCEVYNNTIRNFGTKNNQAQNEGLFIGEGVVGKFYNNLVDTGTGHGISFQGMGNVEFFNNVVLNAGQDGFNASGSNMGIYIPDGYFRIFNNTIYNSGKDGFVFFNNDGGQKVVMNNLVVKARRKLTSRGARMDSSNNIFTQRVHAIRFMNSDTLHADLRLRPGSPAINKGADIRKYDQSLTFDFLKKPRPKGVAFDIGAYEIQ